MTLGLSSYSSLNGLGLITGGTSGYYGGYYGGFGNSQYAEYAKEAITNSYDVTTTQQSFNNMQSTQRNTLTANCQTIQDMLKEGRSDAALDTFNSMVDTLSQYGQYAGYSEEDIKNLIQQQYITATGGSTLLGDVSKYGDSSFTAGLKNSNPISIFLCQSNSKKDLKAEITSRPVSNSAIAGKVAGAAVGGVGFMAAATALTKGNKAWKTAAGAGKGFTGKLADAVSAVGKYFSKGSNWKKVGIAGAVVGVACLGVKWLIDKASDSSAS